jgi:peptidoglycan/LPS O-acetylase OafA/YrhL
MKFIPELAGLRGLAAMMVFFAHAAKDDFMPHFLVNAYGKPGLIIFFILSGFLIAQVYIEKPFTKSNITSYLSARFIRIVPLYLMVIFASYFISSFALQDFHYDFTDKTTLLLSLSFIHTPYEPWTIPVEVQFYFFFIGLWFLKSKAKLPSWILLLVPVLMLIPSLIYAFYFHKIPHVMGSFCIFFCIGIWISELHEKNSFKRLIDKAPTHSALLLLILMVIVFPILRYKMGILSIGSWYDPLSLVTIMTLFILIIAKPEQIRFLKLRPLVFMSEISYGFYLIHRPIMKLVKENYGNSLVMLAITFVIATLLSFVTYKLIEVGFRKWAEARLNPQTKMFP